MANSIYTDEKIFGNLDEKLKEYLKTLQQMHAEVDKISKVQIVSKGSGTDLKKIHTDIDKINKSEKDLLKTSKEVIEAEKLLEKAFKEEQKAKKEALKEEQKLAKEREKIIKLQNKEEVRRAKARQKEAIQRRKNIVTEKQADAALRKTITSEQDLSRTTALLTKRLVQINVTTKKGRDEYNRLTVAIARNNKQLRALGKARQNDIRNVGNYQSALGGLKNSFSGLTGALGIAGGIALLGQGISALANKTKELSKLKRQLANTFNITGQEAKILTANINALANNVDGVETEELTNAINTVQKEFSELDPGQVFDLIEEGFLKGSNNSGQFIDILKEYPAQFKAAGIDAQTMFKIINQQVKQGIYSDKGVDAIKEGGLRLRENTKAVQEALKPIDDSIKLQIKQQIEAGNSFKAIQLVSEALKDTSLTAEETQTIIADVFGGAGEDAGLRYLQTLSDINTELEDSNEQVSELDKANLELEKSWNKVVLSFETGSSLISKAWSTVVSEFSRSLSIIADVNSGLGRLFSGDSIIDIRLDKYKELNEFNNKVSKDLADIQKLANNNFKDDAEALEVFRKQRLRFLDNEYSIIDSKLTNSNLSKDETVELLFQRDLILAQVNNVKSLQAEKTKVLTTDKAITQESKKQVEQDKKSKESEKEKKDDSLKQFKEAQALEQANFEQSQLQRTLNAKKAGQTAKELNELQKVLSQDAKVFKIQQLQEYLDFLVQNETNLTDAQKAGIKNTMLALQIEVEKFKEGVKPPEEKSFLAKLLGLDNEGADKLKGELAKFGEAFRNLTNQILENRKSQLDAELSASDEIIAKNQQIIESETAKYEEAKKLGAAASSTRKQEAEKQIQEELARQKKIEAEQRRIANVQKGLAIGRATIDTALVVLNALKTDPYPLGLALAVTAGATGALQIATIASQQFYEGTNYAELNGAKPGRDTIPAFINEGERIVPTKDNKKIPRGFPNELIPLAISEFLQPHANLEIKEKYTNFNDNSGVIKELKKLYKLTEKGNGSEIPYYRNGVVVGVRTSSGIRTFK